MSYCVNCGVELDPSLKKCPLCNTPVINPNELEGLTYEPPFPTVKGQVDPVKRKDLFLFTIVVLLATSLSCLALNLFVYSRSLWSLFIIGICLVLFVFLLPAFIQNKIPIYVSLLFDGISIGIYLYLITYNTRSNEWFFQLALPVTVLLTILAEIFTLLIHTFRFSFLSAALYIFAEIAVFCVALELLIDRFCSRPLYLGWSAIVLTVCSVIVIALIAMLSMQRLRDAVRRRLHF